MFCPCSQLPAKDTQLWGRRGRRKTTSVQNFLVLLQLAIIFHQFVFQGQMKWANLPLLRQPLVRKAYCNSPGHRFMNMLEEAEEHHPPCVAKLPNCLPGKADDRDILRNSGITGYSAEPKLFFCTHQQHPGAGSYSATKKK